MTSIHDYALDRKRASYVPMTPASFMARSAGVYPDRIAVIHNSIRRTWAETYDRCRRVASALRARGVSKGDTVSIIATNIPEIYETHFAVPMTGGVLNAINTRLDAEAIAFILNHAETKVFLVGPEFSEVADRAIHMTGRRDIQVIDILDPSYAGGRRIGHATYDDLVAEGDPDFQWAPPDDEWDAISLTYTAGTTGNPKGVVYHYRGAHLNALANIATWEMGARPVYLWTLPMFHCNGWCFPWTIAAAAGTIVCLRAVRDEPILRLMREEGVTHFCGASVVLALIVHAADALKQGLPKGIRVLTGGAPPPAIIIEKMEALGFDVTHGYGLTETYGPAVTCAWHPEWDAFPAAERARPHERWGETPCALVRLRPGAAVTEAEIIAFCRQNMAHFKAPKTVVFTDLPKTSTGKIQKFLLRDQARAMDLQG